MLKPLFLATIGTALNHYLALADNRSAVLLPLAGKTIAITVQPFNETVYLCCGNDSIQVLDYSVDAPDTLLEGSLWALGWMGVSANPMRGVFAGQVNISGDMHTGRKFQELFAKLDINLEIHLGRLFGNAVAHQVTSTLQQGQAWGRESVDSLRMDLTEFVQEETRDLPPAAELDVHYRQVDQLRTGFDRLSSRIDRLEALLQTGKTPS
jgi:ubiquinone biosynthesis accessory factor UbiJ